jgi:hypothetical protein
MHQEGQKPSGLTSLPRSRESSSAGTILSLAISKRAPGLRLTTTVRRPSRIRVWAGASLRTDFFVSNTRTLRRGKIPRGLVFPKLPICRPFMPEEGLEPPTRGL